MLLTMVRMHQVDMIVDMLGHAEGREAYVARALRAIASFDGPGAAVFIRDPSRSSLSERLGRGHVAYQGESAIRDYGLGAQVLVDLGVQKMIMLSSSEAKPAALVGFGLQIVERRAIP